MKRIVIAMLFWAVTSVVMGQITSVQAPVTSAFNKAADQALARLDRTGVTSGTLYDRTFPAADLLDPNLISSPGHFRQAYLEFYAASYNTDYRITPNDLKNLIWGSEQQGVVPVGVLFSRMQSINPDAVELDNNQQYRLKIGFTVSQLYQAASGLVTLPFNCRSGLPARRPTRR
jgi:hypothetical protein